MLRYQACMSREGQVLVHTPEGKTFQAEDNGFLEHLRAGTAGGADLKLLQVTDQERPFTDVRQVALHSLQTVRKLAAETGEGFDARRLRSNIVLDLPCDAGFAEDGFAGRRLKIGDVVLQVKERIPRCRMVSLDPEISAHDPGILRQLARSHGGRAGIYARVEISGTIHLGDPVFLL